MPRANLGYAPNRFAQALKTNRTMTIACIVPDITNPFYPALMRGIQSITDGLNYDVIAVNTDGTAERERHFLDWSRQGRVDGVIGVFFTLRAGDFRPLVEAGVPVVRIESSKKRGGDLPIDDIFVDSHAAAYAVTQYLIGRGHKRIAMIAGRGGPQAVRIEGYRAGAARSRRHAACRARRRIFRRGRRPRGRTCPCQRPQADGDLCRQRPDGHRRHAGAARARTRHSRTTWPSSASTTSRPPSSSPHP